MRWTIYGVVAAGMVAILGYFAGAYNAWTDLHGALHNIAAIITGVVVFGAIGASIGHVVDRAARRRRG